MDIVKKNLVSVICGVVALLAIVATFVYPLPQYWDELRTQVAARSKVADSVSDLSKTKVTLPKLRTDSEPLTVDLFPTADITKLMEESIESLKSKSQLIYTAAVKRDTKALMMPGLLPRPVDSMMPKFRESYARIMNLGRKPFPAADGWIGKNGSLGQVNGEDIVLGGTMPPTDEEVRLQAEAVAADTRGRLTKTSNGVVTNQSQVESAIREKTKNLREEMRVSRAYAGNVYVDHESLSPVQGVAGGNQPGVITSSPGTSNSGNDLLAYNAQVNLWVHQEFLRGVVTTNGESRGVPDSPIKRIVRLEIPQSVVGGSTTNNPMGGQAAPAPAGPVDLPVDSTAPIATVAGVPFGHATNPMYDVIRFRARLHVAAAKLPQILLDLQRGHLLTVTNVASITVVDPTVLAAMGYLYGNDPIVEVVLDCDQLMLRAWTVPLMSDGVKSAIVAAAAPPVQ